MFGKTEFPATQRLLVERWNEKTSQIYGPETREPELQISIANLELQVWIANLEQPVASLTSWIYLAPLPPTFDRL